VKLAKCLLIVGLNLIARRFKIWQSQNLHAIASHYCRNTQVIFYRVTGSLEGVLIKRGRAIGHEVRVILVNEGDDALVVLVPALKRRNRVEHPFLVSAIDESKTISLWYLGREKAPVEGWIIAPFQEGEDCTNAGLVLYQEHIELYLLGCGGVF